MKQLILLLAALPAFAVPTLSNLTLMAKSHSWLFFQFETSEVFVYSRVRYGKTASYEGGAGGGIWPQQTNSYACCNSQFLSDNKPTASVLAVEPSTLYYVCVEASNDGTTWYGCSGSAATTATTDPAPAIDPAPPQAVTDVDTTRPNWSGWTTLTVASDCSDIQSKINTAAANQASQNTKVVVPNGAVCGPITIPDSGEWRSMTLNSANGNITLSSHGYSVSDKVRFVPGAGGGLPAEIVVGNDYFVSTVVDANTFRVKATLTASEITSWSSTGSGTRLVSKWPMPNKYKMAIISAATNSGTFLPEGVQVTGEWGPVMPKFNADFSTPAMTPLTGAANVYISGLHLTHPDTASTDILTTPDPRIYQALVNSMSRGVGGVIFDQLWLHGLGFPSKLYRAIWTLAGENSALVNSRIEGVDKWEPFATLSAVKTSATRMTVNTGAYYAGPFTFTVATPITVDLTGGSVTCSYDSWLDGCFLAYIAMDNRLKVVIPTGMTATCSAQCDVLTSAYPALPYDATIGRVSGIYVAVATLSSGQFNAFFGAPNDIGAPCEMNLNGQGSTRTGVCRGLSTETVNAGTGPGPLKFHNNYFNSTGITIHFDDSMLFARAWRTPDNLGWTKYGDLSVTRNRFTSNVPYFCSGMPGSLGTRAGHRNHLEFKAGDHILVKGNIFDHACIDVTFAQDVPIVPVAGSRATDYEVRSNLIFSNGMTGPFLFSPDTIQPMPWPLTRARISNNLVYGTDGWYWRASNVQGLSGGFWTVFDQGQSEDVVYDHNTWFGGRGSQSSALRKNSFSVHGFGYTNNFAYLHSQSFMVQEPVVWGGGSPWLGWTPTCSGNGASLADCYFRTGVGNPDRNIKGNVFVLGYTGTDGGTSTGNASVSAFTSDLGAYASLNAVVPGSAVSDRITAAKMVTTSTITQALVPELFLRYDSPYVAGTTDGKPPGVDREQLISDLGLVENVYAHTVTSSGFTVHARVPDSGGKCYIGYGTTALPVAGDGTINWTKTSANTTASRERNIAVSGLSAGTYHYQVWCAGTAPTDTRDVRVQ